MKKGKKLIFKIELILCLPFLICLFCAGCMNQPDNPGSSNSGSAVQTINGKDKVSFNLVLQSVLASNKSSVNLQEIRIAEADIGLMTPSGENLVTNWFPGEASSIKYSGMDYGTYTLNLVEINELNNTNRSSFNFIVQKGFDYDIIVNLGGNIDISINTNEAVNTNTASTNSPGTNYVFLDTYRNQFSGQWSGTVTTPWVYPYQVSVIFYTNGNFSGSALSATSNIGSSKITNCPSFYYGSDEDSSLKVYSIDSVSNSDGYPAGTAAFGSISVTSSSNSVSKGSIRSIKFSADFNHLEFEFWHRNRYGPIKFQLDRVL